MNIDKTKLYKRIQKGGPGSGRRDEDGDPTNNRNYTGPKKPKSNFGRNLLAGAGTAAAVAGMMHPATRALATRALSRGGAAVARGAGQVSRNLAPKIYAGRTALGRGVARTGERLQQSGMKDIKHVAMGHGIGTTGNVVSRLPDMDRAGRIASRTAGAIGHGIGNVASASSRLKHGLGRHMSGIGRRIAPAAERGKIGRELMGDRARFYGRGLKNIWENIRPRAY